MSLMVVILNYTLIQICIKNYDVYYKENWFNKLIKVLKLDAYNKVYYYEDGKPIDKEFDFEIRNSFYQDALDYINIQQSKKIECLKKISESLNQSKQQFKNIIQKNYNETGNLSVDKKFEDFSATVKGLHKLSMEQIKNKFDENHCNVDKQIEAMTKSINELTRSVNEILLSKK